MKLLLDTHVFLWLNLDPAALSTRAESLCADPANSLYLSTASAWEIRIKADLGKLDLEHSLRDMIHRQQVVNGLEILTVELDHIDGLANLAHHHRDPFDRIIVAQAIHERMTLISHDRIMPQYPVQLVW